MRLPVSWISSMADWFQVPAVSTATGKKIWEADSAPYFTVLFAAALFAAEHASLAVWSMCDSAYVSGTLHSLAASEIRQCRRHCNASKHSAERRIFDWRNIISWKAINRLMKEFRGKSWTKRSIDGLLKETPVPHDRLFLEQPTVSGGKRLCCRVLKYFGLFLLTRKYNSTNKCSLRAIDS